MKSLLAHEHVISVRISWYLPDVSFDFETLRVWILKGHKFSIFAEDLNSNLNIKETEKSWLFLFSSEKPIKY